MSLNFHVNSLFSSISYRIEGILIDPGDEWEGFDNVDKVLLTHAHFDHIYGINRVLEMNPEVKVYTNEVGREMLLNAKKNLSRYHESPIVISKPDAIVTVNDGDEMDLDNGITAKAVFTPGHNPSCITWIIGDAIFTGDSYIPGIMTVTNLPDADKRLVAQSESLILSLAKGKTILPGHNVVSAS